MTQYAYRFRPSVFVVVYSVYIDKPVEIKSVLSNNEI